MTNNWKGYRDNGYQIADNTKEKINKYLSVICGLSSDTVIYDLQFVILRFLGNSPSGDEDMKKRREATKGASQTF